MLGLALRGLFIVDPSGTIRSMMVNDDQVGRSVSEVLRLVRAYQHADAHGTVCPAGWQHDGDATITPDPDRAKDFFHSKVWKK